MLSYGACKFTDAAVSDQLSRLRSPFKPDLFIVVFIHFQLFVARMPAVNTGSGWQPAKSECLFRENPISKRFPGAIVSTGHAAFFAGVKLNGVGAGQQFIGEHSPQSDSRSKLRS